MFYIPIFQKILKKIRWRPRIRPVFLSAVVERKKKTKEDFKKLQKNANNPLRSIKRESVYVCTVIIIIGIVSHAHTLFPFLEGLPWYVDNVLKQGEGHYQDLIAIHAGIGAILIGLAFLIAEKIIGRDKGDDNKYIRLLLLQSSHFITLLFAEILSFAIFAWGSVNPIALLSIVIVSVMTIIAVYKTIELYVKGFPLKQGLFQLWENDAKGRFLQILEKKIEKRFGDNHLVSEFQNKSDGTFEVSIFWSYYKDEYIVLNAIDHSGVVTDINLTNLQRIINFIADINERKLINTTRDSEGVSKTQNTQKIDKPDLVIAPCFKKTTKNFGNQLIWVKKDVYEQAPEKIEKIAKKIFTVKPIDEGEVAATYDLDLLRRECIRSIEEDKEDELEIHLGLHVDLVRIFYEVLELYGNQFSTEQADKERTRLFGGRFIPTEWLPINIEKLFDQAIKKGDENIVRTIAYTKFRLAHQAITHRDHLIFPEIIHFPRFLYQHAKHQLENGNKKMGELISDMSWRYLHELAEYQLQHELGDGLSREEFQQYAKQIMLSYQNLLKVTLDTRDVEGFSLYAGKFSKLFKHLRSDYETYTNEERNDFVEEVTTLKSMVLFGVAMWLLHLHKNNKNVKEIEEMFEVIRGYLDQNIPSFTKTFLRCYSFDTEKQWRWDDWEMQEKEEGEVHSIRILEKCERLFAVHMLRMLSQMNQGAIQNTKLEPDRGMVYLAEGGRVLNDTLEEIKESPKDWFLSDREIDKHIQNFKDLLEQAKSEQEDKDLERKRELRIDPERVKEFKKGFLKSYEDNHPITGLFSKFNALIDATVGLSSKGILRYGVNTISNKAPFFGKDVDWHTHYLGLDESFGYGRRFCLDDNMLLLQSIKSQYHEIKYEQLNEKIREIGLDNIIIISTNRGSWNCLRKTGNFISSWDGRFQPSQLGYEDYIEGNLLIDGAQIPIHHVYSSAKDQNFIFAIDKRKAGKIKLLSPINTSEEEMDRFGNFYISVDELYGNYDEPESYSKALKLLLDDQPDWLEKIGGLENKVAYLKEHVVIKIFRRVHFESNDEAIGYYINTDNCKETKDK